ncbi:MAG: nucleic acid-binding [Lasallia pustulata]|uniref:rRNA biogenesis protein RRP5 n=1 Tax=Lasallia pustulata TaxID=136370 RepID=A0A5M8PI75_9LECA|nr:MAG: nucleic acid-binding [Lasallia pustulata]
MAPIKRKSDAPKKAVPNQEHVAKRQKKSQDPEPSTLSALREEEPAFPRGGASVLTPLEYKQIQIQATKDVLFEQNTGRKAPKHGPEDSQNEVEEEEQEQVEGPLATSKRKPRPKVYKDKKGQSVVEEPGIRIEGLSYKRLVPGSLVLGQISQLNRHDIALALPNNLTGYVPLTAISDKLTKRLEALVADEEEDEDTVDPGKEQNVDLSSFFTVGQYLRAHVTSTHDDTVSGGKGKKRIELSINPRHANAGLKKADLVVNTMAQATVTSVEDHGLIMDLGIDEADLRGFMSSKELGHGVDHTRIEEGAVLLCLVTGLSSNGNVIKLSADRQRMGNTKKTNFLTDAPSVDSFLPGTAVEILVAEVTLSGIAGKVMGLLDVTADLIHSGYAASGKELGKKYTTGSKVKGRIICTFPTSDFKKLGVSFLGHIMSVSSCMPTLIKGNDGVMPTQALPISTIVDEARVVKVQPGIGLLLDVGVKGVRGFVHISRVADGKTESLSESIGPYKVGSVHRARIVGYNPVDGLFLASLEQKIINEPFLRIEDVQIGQIVKGKIEKLVVNATGVGGVLVNIAAGITGLVPEIHLADIHLQHPEKKFREGLSVTARILSVDLEKRQIRMTLKKSLVNTDAAIWSSFDNLAPGMHAPGTLVSILSSGAIVQFYGSVRGFLPVSEMSESYIRDPKQHFRTGQVVSVYIVSVDPPERRMRVSCKDPSVFSSAQQKALEELNPGNAVTGTVSEKTNDELVVDLEGSGLKAVLPIEHLADGSEQKCLSLAKKIRVDQKLRDLVVLSKNETKRLIRLTSKPSLVKAARAGQLLTKFEDLVQGAEVTGCVKNVTLTGVFVQFGGDLTGLLLRAHMPDEAVRLPDFGMRRGQTISTRVLSVDHGQRRFLLTLKHPAVPATAPARGQGILSASDRAVLNAADGVSKSIDDFTLGKLTKAKITSIKETQLNVHLADDVQGRVDVSQIFDSWDDIKNKKHPLQIFHSKQILPVRILGVHNSRSHRFLPITHSDKVPVFELSAKPQDQTSTELDVLTLDKVKVGSTWLVFVNNVADDCLWVNLSPNVRGRIRTMDVSDDVSHLTDLAKNFPIGSALRARAINVDSAQNRLDLAARSGSTSSPETLNDLSKGMVLPGRVTKVTERQLMVQLSGTICAPVHLIDLADDYSTANPTQYSKNQIVRVCITGIEIPNKKIVLSTRRSRVLSSSLPVKDPEITSIAQLKVNDVVRGFIKNVADNGVFIALASNITAFVRVSDLSDSFIKDWKSNFQVDQLVKGKIIAVDALLNHVQMSLKQSVLDKDYKAPLTFADIKVGEVVTGKVRKVEDFGLFIVVDDSANVSGLCHRSEVADQRVADVRKLYEEGDTVKAKVLKIDIVKRRISFGLKASYFETDGDGVDHSDDEEDEGMDGVELAGHDDDDNDDDGDEGMDEEEVDVEKVRDMDSDSDVEDSNGVQIEDGMTKRLGTSEEVEGLSTGGFDWSGRTLDQVKTDPQSETDGGISAVKKKRRRKAEIKVDLTGDLDAKGPQSIADFERLLMGQPDSSYLWLSYMAFQLQLSEVANARETAERALQTINIREDAEKMNVWVGLLNLENTYGSEESVEEAFKRACQYNDAQEIHERLISIYIQCGKNEKADGLFQSMIKKFSQDPKVWLNYATFLFDTLSAPDRARDLLPRAMQSLPKYNHLDLTSKFAQLEFRSPNGDAERGRTIFEGLLSTFPKRLDLWNVLLDLEIKQGDQEQVRRLFARVTSSKLKSRKARFFFKRWLQYEEAEGDAKHAVHVKAKAAEYVKQHEAEKAQE